MMQLAHKNRVLQDYKEFVRLSACSYDFQDATTPRYIRLSKYKANKVNKNGLFTFMVDALREKVGFNRFTKFYFSKIVRASLKLLRQEETNGLTVEACTGLSKFIHALKNAIHLDALRDNLAAGAIKVTLTPKLSVSPFARQAQ